MTLRALRRRAADLGLRLKKLRRPRWADMVQFELIGGHGYIACASRAEAERVLSAIALAASS